MATIAEKLINCVICTDAFTRTDRQVLPCDHVFCKGCVNRMTDDEKIKCPICSKVCGIYDVMYHYEMEETTVGLTNLLQSSADKVDVTQNHVTLTADDKCEACEENVINSLCNQCQQWFCKVCRNAHQKMTTSERHTYTELTSVRRQLSKDSLTDIIHLTKSFKQKAKGLKSMSEAYETWMEEQQTSPKCAAHTSKALQKSFHEDIDKHFDTIDERIEIFVKTNSKVFTDQYQDIIHKMTSCIALTNDIESSLTQNHSKTSRMIAAQDKQLLSQAEVLLKSMAGMSMDVVEIPQMRLEREQNWSLEGAVDLDVQYCTVRVCNPHVSIFIYSHNVTLTYSQIYNVDYMYTLFCYEPNTFRLLKKASMFLNLFTPS